MEIGCLARTAALPADRLITPFVRFFDDAGRRWQLNDQLHLEPAPPDETGDGW
jgi:hypothetical protein